MNRVFLKFFLAILCFKVAFFVLGISNIASAQNNPRQSVPILPNTNQQKQDTTAKSLSQTPANQTPSAMQVNRQAPQDTYKTFQRPSSKIFGSELFSQGSLSFQPNLRIATPSNYILGPDDELLINVSGFQETTVKTTVLPEGTIFIPQVGKLNVNGLSIDAATSAVRNAMVRTAYPSIASGTSRLSITLSNIKSIHVTIIGGYKPGDYTLSSLTTLFNALFVCGGPGDINTYRDIQLIRGGRIVAAADLYQFLTKGNLQGNLLLRQGDVINIPVYQKHIFLTGEVKKPGIFELKKNETLNDLLFFAGGYTDKAYKGTIKVKQITDIERTIKDLNKSQIATYLPSDGDSINIAPVLNRYVNAVIIAGAVYRPGEFEYYPGLSVSALIGKAGGLTENVFTERALVLRNYLDGRKESFAFNVTKILNGTEKDIFLAKGDSVNIATATQFKSNYKIKILGEVKKPGEFEFRNNLTLKDLFFMASGFTDAASSYHVEVSRRFIEERSNKSADTIAKIFSFNTDKNLSVENSDFLLQPYDIVTVRRNPGYVIQQKVTIVGEVNYPGDYAIESKRDRVSDLLRKAGGLTSLAYSKGISLIRSNLDSTNMVQLKTIAKIQKSIKDSSSNVIDDVTRNNDRIAINLQKVLNEPGSSEDYILESNDKIEVLKTNPLVKISGEVLSSTKTGFIEDKSLQYYLSQAGGTTEFARRGKIYVLYANGKTGRTNNGIFGLFRSYPSVEPGAEIVVPRKLIHKGLSTTETVGLTSALISVISLIIVTISSLKR